MPARPGSASPSRRAPLSNASPAASSSVAPSTSKPPALARPARGTCGRRWRSGRGTAARTASGAGSSRPTWPWRWSTGANGSPRAAAIAFAVATPTSSAPTRPGPCGDGDERRRRRGSRPAARSASSTTDVDQLEVVARGDLRHDAAVAVVDALRGDRRSSGSRRRASTTAAQVSSQLVSMREDHAGATRGRHRLGVRDVVEPARERRGRAPHDQRVLAVVLVVAAAQSRRSGSRSARTARSPRWLERPHLERDCARRRRDAPIRLVEQAPSRCPCAARRGSTATFITCQTVS